MDYTVMFTLEARIAYLERKMKELSEALIEENVISNEYRFYTLDEGREMFDRFLEEYINAPQEKGL